mmetsp:Transcript_22650/g.34226  ORF Transcript_22650/g.34226 Transcript_22650/m.34226 type:complete len:268 (-) Transcript_22650:283-1086(-)|eukprot:CAMPEP_0178925856 /NCGR_PEP_ID=MMETSP0786-20121207/18168_1 /TAXON_ID=186022 /ORGANISM="Thalassionema frauenfeldii, Strain CCMP 1798" /LENGTH=267 /DNA_ID=CAMNT_0020600831 /DNA_START=16 /DNA_END=819 /DNA_ORIENTATION=-
MSKQRRQQQKSSFLSDSLRAKDTTPVDKTMLQRWRYLQTNYPELIDHKRLQSWAWMYLEMGHKDMAENLKSYYSNISIVAALAAGFSISGILAPGFDMEDSNDDIRIPIIGINGAILVSLLFACVLDCIMIENSLRLVSDEKYMLEFIKTEGTLLCLPLLFFIFGLGSTVVNIALSLWMVYGTLTGMVASASLLVTALGVLRRYLLTSRKIVTYAALGLDEMAAAAEMRSIDEEEERSTTPNPTAIVKTSKSTKGSSRTEGKGRLDC